MADISKRSICFDCERIGCEYLKWLKTIKASSLEIEILHCPEFTQTVRPLTGMGTG